MLAEVIEAYDAEYIREDEMRDEFADLVYANQKERLPAQAKSGVDQLKRLVDEGETLRETLGS